MSFETTGVDTEMSKAFLRMLKKQGMKFKLSTGVVASEVTADGVNLTVKASKGNKPEEVLSFDVVLVSTGRRPFTKGLGLEEMGIEMDRLGRVVVNEHFQTKIPSIYAFGDVIDGPMLAQQDGVSTHRLSQFFVWCCESGCRLVSGEDYGVCSEEPLDTGSSRLSY